jgi:probable rRNA maturation factor
MPVQIRNRLRQYSLHSFRYRALADRILRAAGDPQAELSVELVGDSRMRQLNQAYRGINRPTDVLAFSMREAPGPASSLLGDVVISLHTAVRQAKTAGHSLDHEVVRLLIHGVLHLLGYDHERSPRDARVMRLKEQAIFRALGRVPKLFTRRSRATGEGSRLGGRG